MSEHEAVLTQGIGRRGRPRSHSSQGVYKQIWQEGGVAMKYKAHKLVDLFSKQWRPIKEDTKQGISMIGFEFQNTLSTELRKT